MSRLTMAKAPAARLTVRSGAPYDLSVLMRSDRTIWVPAHHLLVTGLWMAVALAAPTSAHAQPADARASRPSASHQAIRIAFEQQQLVLGDQSALAITIETNPDVHGLRLSTNAGRVTAARATAPGRYTATYHAPDLFFPQVAIVAATATRGGRQIMSWAALPLWGKGDATVDAQPGAPVTVRIGQRTYGPVRANERGTARVEVVVPPGVQHGRSGHQRVDLGVPPFNRLHVVATPQRFAGVQPRRVALLLIAVDARGEATTTAGLYVNAFGQRTKAAPVEPSLWRAEIEVPPGRPVELPVEAKIVGAPTSRVTLQLTRTAGPPTKIQLSAPQQTAAGPITVQARVADELGTPVDSIVQGTCSTGTLGPFVRRATGRYEALWRPGSPSAAATVEVRVRTQKGGSGRLDIALAGPDTRRRLRPAWFWTTTGVSAALLVAGTITRVMALTKSNEYNAPETSLDRRRELRDSGERLNVVSGVALGIGAAGAVGAAVLYWFTDFGYSDRQALSATPLPGGAALGWTQHF